MANVLFVCRQNAGRSQMSQALFKLAAGDDHHARSAGTTPAAHVHPEVVGAMLELGVDLADRTPQRLTDDLAHWADVVVTMGCGDECPYIPGKRYIDWDLDDPHGQPIEQVRTIRDDIARRVEVLQGELGAPTVYGKKYMGIQRVTCRGGLLLVSPEVGVRRSAQPRRTQRKPMWLVEVSTASGWRAAGR